MDYATAPKVIIKNKAGEVLFLQVLDNSKQINKLIQQGMENPRGTNFILSVENNGHVMSFELDKVDIESVARVANGIKVSEKKDDSPEKI